MLVYKLEKNPEETGFWAVAILLGHQTVNKVNTLLRLFCLRLGMKSFQGKIERRQISSTIDLYGSEARNRSRNHTE